MAAILPQAVHHIKHDGITPLPMSVLREIVQTLKFDPTSPASGPDGKSNHTTAAGLERTAFMVLGREILEWQKKLSARESGYDNQQLGRKVFLCCRPILSQEEAWLGSGAIMDALRVYEQDDDLSFACYGAYDASYQFSEKDLRKTANRYAFVFNTASTGSGQFIGSHWVVLFIDLLSNCMDYYDSTGMYPNRLLQKAIACIFAVIRKSCPELTHEVNYTRHRKQTGGDACGFFVVHYVVQRLFGKSFQEFNQQYLPDHEVMKYRSVYWTEVDRPLFEDVELPERADR